MSTNPGLSNQQGVRNTLRILGPVVAVVGLVIFILGVKKFVGTMDSEDMGFPGAAFAMFFGGFILFGIGMTMARAGFLGVGLRYVTGEAAPVARDGLEYLTRGQGLGNLGRSPSSDADVASGPFCRSCGTRNDAEASFCDKCGQALA